MLIDFFIIILNESYK